MTRHRVQLLGKLLVSDELGNELPVPEGLVTRAIVALALRPEQPRTINELNSLLWDNRPYTAPEVSVPINRAKKLIPIPPSRRNSSVYETSLTRSEVDLTDFIDRVHSLDTTQVEEIDALLGMWRGRPEIEFGFIPVSEFQALSRARHSLISVLEGWGLQQLGQLRHIDTFRSLFDEECANLPTAAVVPSKRLLLVDDDENLTNMVVQLLAGYQVLVAHSVGDAMTAIVDSNSRIDGALVDLHLTARGLDSQGLQVIDALRTYRPEVPRILMTSSPPADALSQVQRDYGLHDILVKSSTEAPVRTRRIVDDMMSDNEEHVIQRARTTLETLAARVLRVGAQGVVAARRGIRQGTATENELQYALAELDRIQTASETATEKIALSQHAGDADQIVSDYTSEFASYLGAEVAR